MFQGGGEGSEGSFGEKGKLFTEGKDWGVQRTPKSAHKKRLRRAILTEKGGKNKYRGKN